MVFLYLNIFTENESTEKKGVLKLLKMILGVDHNKTIALSHTKNGIHGFTDVD
jgi:hypothetical protein